MIPKTWHSVPLQRYVDLMQGLADEDENDNIWSNQIRRAVLLTGLSVKEAKKLPPSSAKQIADLLKTELPKALIVKKFHIGGHWYRVITKPHRLSTGQLEKRIADARTMPTKRVIGGIMTKAKEEKWHQALFSCCEPIKRKRFLGIPIGWKVEELEDWEVEERVKAFKMLPMGIAYPIVVFFLTLSNRLSSHIDTYLIKEIQKIKEQLDSELLEINTDG